MRSGLNLSVQGLKILVNFGHSRRYRVKKQRLYLLLPAVFTLVLAFSAIGSRSLADTEIDLSALDAPTPTVAAAPAATPTLVAAPPLATPTPASNAIELEENTQPATQTAPQPTPTVYEVHGVLKMKDVYDAGKKAYQEQDYDQAIRYWKKAVTMKDPYTPKFYYAEAYSMLGIIYQYHIIHYGHAYRCYRAALKYERHNPTARKHIRQVYKYRNRKD